MNGTSIDITLITAGAMNRLVLFPIIASRWSGSAPPIPLTRSPILFVLHVKEEEEATLQSTLRSPDYTTLCQPRITLLVYLSSATAFFHSNYPINILRNLGIRHCRTTHFLLLDTDMLVSKDAYPTLMQLRDSLLRRWRLRCLPSSASTGSSQTSRWSSSCRRWGGAWR